MTERPWLGGLLALAGAGIMALAGTEAVLFAATTPTVSDVLTYTIEFTAGAVVATAAILALIVPRERRVLGYVIASFSLLSFFGRTGILCFGSMAGVFGAAALLVWSPAVAPACRNCGAPMRPAALLCPKCGAVVPPPSINRPAEVFAIALTAVFFVHLATALAAVGPYPLRRFPPLELLPGLVAEAALLLGGAMAYRKPDEDRTWGAVLIAGAVLAIVGPYWGFVLGPALGFAAGATAFRSKGDDMKLGREQRRTLGILALLLGIGLAVGGIVYGQLRFPMTNYTSTITVEHPVAYYEHELRAGDTLFFHIEVTGSPATMEIRRGSADGLGDLVLAATVGHWTIVPFPVPSTGTYSVAFRTTCETCTSFVRAQVDQSLGSLGILPLPVTVALGIALGAVGGAVLAARRILTEKRSS